MRNIKNIYFNIGAMASSGHIHDFFTKNRKRLACLGIAYPDFVDDMDLSGQQAAFTLINKAMESPEALAEYLKPLANLKVESPDSSTPPGLNTLVLSTPSFFRYPALLPQAESALKTIFPEAEIHYFASFCHQYLEVSAISALLSLFRGNSPQRNVNIYMRSPELLDYQAALENLRREMPSSDLHFHLSHENPDAPLDLGKDALKSFIDIMGLKENDGQSGLDFSPPSWLLAGLSGEGAMLASLLNLNSDSARKTQSRYAMALPWDSQLPRLMAGKNQLTPLLGDKSRLQIYENYKVSNEAFCKALGQSNFTTPPFIGRDDFTTLNKARACRIVTALEDDFVSSLRETLKDIERPETLEIIFLRLACEMQGILTSGNSQELSLDVLTVAYNQEKYIEECIKSVLAQQTAFPVRHIIVDDVSHDATPDIIARYAKIYPEKIIPVFLKRKHTGDNVITAFNLCDARYAALCDGDDYFTDPLKLQKQVDFLERNPDFSICFHPVEKRYEDGSPSEIYPPDSILPGNGKRRIYTIRDLLSGNFIQTNSVVYRWRFRDGLPDWFDPTLTPADWYWHLLHAETGMIGYLPEPMAVYRRHAASLFAISEKSHVKHRARFGAPELRVYASLDRHFKGLYRKELQTLANGVLSDYVQLFMETEDDSLLQRAIEDYPVFAKNFFSELKGLSNK